MSFSMKNHMVLLDLLISSSVLPGNNISRNSILHLSSSSALLLFIGIWDTHHKAFGQNAEELLDFRGERHFFWYSTPETPGIYGLFPARVTRMARP